MRLQQNSGSWEKNVVLIADDQTEAYEAIFETVNEEAAALLPSKMVALKGYLGDYLLAGDLATDITNWINSGALIVNYSGHASLQQWAAEAILVNADVSTLSNTGMYPFVISMSCLTGYFGYLDALLGPQPSLAEALLQSADKGAVAALMPTGMTTTTGQSILNNAVFEAFFVNDIRELGAAIAAAKQTLLANGDAYYEQISQTFLLFGDPALTLKDPAAAHAHRGCGLSGKQRGAHQLECGQRQQRQRGGGLQHLPRNRPGGPLQQDQLRAG